MESARCTVRKGDTTGDRKFLSIENGCRQYVQEVRDGRGSTERRRKEAWPEKEAGLRQCPQEEVGWAMASDQWVGALGGGSRKEESEQGREAK